MGSEVSKTSIAKSVGMLLSAIYVSPILFLGYIYLITGQHFLWDYNNTKWCNGLYIEFGQNFTKETFSYDEHLKS